MDRKIIINFNAWLNRRPLSTRKPLVLRGARQVGKSYAVRNFCSRNNLACLELNFEREPGLKKLFVAGPNAKTIALLETHFGRTIDEGCLLFFDEIQSAPEVFARLRYFFEDTPEIPVIAAGSLLEFALGELEHSVPVGRIEFLHLGPMRFEEFLSGLGEHALAKLIANFSFEDPARAIPEPFHDRLITAARDFAFVGGMPEAVARYASTRSYIQATEIHRSIVETYRQDFSKYRGRVPLERLERLFDSAPAQVGRKWVHSRVLPNERADAATKALHALAKARVVHLVRHTSGNGVPLAAEASDKVFKVLFLDIGLMSTQLGVTPADAVDPTEFERIHEGAFAEQWVGQHLLDLRPASAAPTLHYWVREKTGSLAEIDYLIAKGARVVPIEVKAGPSGKVRSLRVFLNEKPRSPWSVQVSSRPPRLDRERKFLEIPFYLVERLLELLPETT